MADKNSFLNILLADDDKDDCLLFKEVLNDLQLPVNLTTVNDGEQLINHLSSKSNLPHALFLDLNMPRKNGFECLIEIKNHSTFKNLPVIIYSTSYDEEKAIQLYKAGANYYLCKPANFEELKKVVQRAISLVSHNNVQSSKENFYINKIKSAF